MEDFIKDNLRKRIINTDGDYLMSDKLLIELLNKYHKEQLILNGVVLCEHEPVDLNINSKLIYCEICGKYQN